MLRLNPEALDQARQIHGLTSDEKLAAELGMSGSSVRDMRKGRRGPSVKTLLKLRKLTGIPMEALLLNADEIAA